MDLEEGPGTKQVSTRFFWHIEMVISMMATVKSKTRDLPTAYFLYYKHLQKSNTCNREEVESMSKVIKWLVTCSLIVGLLTMPVLALLINTEQEETPKKQKVIAVVLDDSTSMVRDNNGKKESDYTTRWVEADYAVRALAAMMDEGDVIKLYPMNESTSESINISGRSDAYQDLYDKLDNMWYHAETPFDQIECAAKDMEEETDKECFLIIITDGSFYTESGGWSSKEDVDREFEKVLDESQNIQIKYIQIGNVAEDKLPDEKERIEVYKKETETDDVTTQITNVINSIYSRVAVDGKDKDKLITNNQHGEITIAFNIPVKSVTVFLQSEGDAENTLQSVQSTPAANVITFAGTNKDPDKMWDSGGEDLNAEWIRYRALSGAVLNYTASGGAVESITISNVPDIDNDEIEVYYEPAVEQRIMIQQNDDEAFVYEAGTNPIFVEGTLNLTVEYVDLDGNTLADAKQSDPLLKSNSVTVEVNGHTFAAKQNENGTYTYSGILEASDSGGAITVSNTIKLYGGEQTILLGNIYEASVDLAVEPIEQTLHLDEDGNGSLAVLVRDTKTGNLITEDEWKNYITLTCESTYFEAEGEECTFANGTIAIPVTLKEPSQDQLDESGKETFTITVNRSYSDGVRSDATTGEVAFSVEVTSGPHTLSVDVEDVSLEVWRILFRGAEIPITYDCDGVVLEEEKKPAVTTSLTSEGQLHGLISVKNGDVFLKSVLNGPISIFKWLAFDEENCTVQLDASYTKWNGPAKTTQEVQLNLIPLTLWQKILIIIGLLVIVIVAILIVCWLGWGLFVSGSREDYIKKRTVFQLEMQNVPSEDSKFALYWTWWRWLCFRLQPFGERYAHVYCPVSKGQGKKPTRPRIDLYIARSGSAWKLGKLDGKTKPAPCTGQLTINGKEVSTENCTFGTKDGIGKRLIVKNSDQTREWQVKISDER